MAFYVKQNIFVLFSSNQRRKMNTKVGLNTHPELSHGGSIKQTHLVNPAPVSWIKVVGMLPTLPPYPPHPTPPRTLCVVVVQAGSLKQFLLF